MSYINEQNLTEFDKNIKEYIDNKLLLDKERFAYGIEWDITVSDPHCTRIGNPELHRTLPLQSSMKGCLLADDGTVNEYLPEDDWSNSVLDGSKGQVMVELPDMYVKFESEGNKRRAWMSTMPLVGFHLWKKCYVSAYEASIQRSTNKLCSVCNLDPDYRGGDNTAEWDGTYRSLLGIPVSNMSLSEFRIAARNRGSINWNCYMYHVHKMITWLYYVEYSCFNIQESFNSELSINGFRQGGLGIGCTNLNNPPNKPITSFLTCGLSNNLGNNSGVIFYTIPNEYENNFQVQIPRYRGIENVFGHLWKRLDGCYTQFLNNIHTFWISTDINNITNYNSYINVGVLANNQGYVKEIILGQNGEIAPKIVKNLPNTMYFCDYCYNYMGTTPVSVLHNRIGGSIETGFNSGLVFFDLNTESNFKNSFTGTRLCYIP